MGLYPIIKGEEDERRKGTQMSTHDQEYIEAEEQMANLEQTTTRLDDIREELILTWHQLTGDDLQGASAVCAGSFVDTVNGIAKAARYNTDQAAEHISKRFG